ncbi:MAG TPA: RsmE family RNA methyltransferase [Treponemataceae bacterium]|nr:RsmE family RNA methyltransferase [Treponemataceae bacterium]
MNIVLFSSEDRFFSTDERYRHITKILGKGEGDSFYAGRVNGPAGTARITRCDESVLVFDFDAAEPFRSLHPVRMIIGFPRPIQLKRLLRDLASLGAGEIILAGTDLGEKSYRESRLADPDIAKKNILDGCVQAGGTALPDLTITSSVDEALRLCGTGNAVRIVLDIDPAAGPLSRQDLSGIRTGNPLVLAIGSERGWSGRERALFNSHDFTPCSLGSRILRTETAATAALAVALSGALLLEG